MIEYKIKKIGTLKYTRLKSLSVLRKKINSFDFEYSMLETKELLDSILNNVFEEQFDLVFKICFDEIFDNNEYIEYNKHLIDETIPSIDWLPQA